MQNTSNALKSSMFQNSEWRRSISRRYPDLGTELTSPIPARRGPKRLVPQSYPRLTERKFHAERLIVTHTGVLTQRAVSGSQTVSREPISGGLQGT